MTALEVYGGVMFLVSGLGIVAFVVLYAFRSPWRATPEGKQFLRFMAIVATIVVAAVAFGLIHWEEIEHVRIWARAVLYSALAYAVWRFVYLLLRAQRRARRRSHEGRVTNGKDS